MRAPNLTAIRRDVLQAFVADPECVFTAITVPHLELITYAHLAKDKVLTNYLSTNDPFSKMAEAVGVTRDEVKIVAYAHLYGDLAVAARRLGDTERFVGLVRRYREHFSASSEFLGKDRSLTVSRRVLNLAAKAHVEAVKAAHDATVADKGSSTYAAALFPDRVVFTHPNHSALPNSVVDSYTDVITKMIHAAAVEVTTASTLADL